MTDDHEEIIAECQEWLAARRAWLDQREKQFEEQYSFVPPCVNRERLEDLEIWKFRIEIHEWELEQLISEGGPS